jgi:hypothetical protein
MTHTLPVERKQSQSEYSITGQQEVSELFRRHGGALLFSEYEDRRRTSEIGQRLDGIMREYFRRPRP